MLHACYLAPLLMAAHGTGTLGSQARHGPALVLLGIQTLALQGQELLIYVEGASKHGDLPHATSQARPPAQGRGWDALFSLASRAAVVVTEDMPVPPDAQWLQVILVHVVLKRWCDDLMVSSSR